MARKNLISSVNTNGSFSEGSKKTLRKIAEAAGEFNVLDTAFAATSQATIGSGTVTNWGSWELKAGRKYLFTANGLVTATAASGGYQFKFNLSGTQTSAVFNGNALFYNADTGAAITATTAALDASTVVATVAAANAVAKARLEAYLYLQPQNDGLLTVQFAQQTSSANACTIKAGAVLAKFDLE